MPIEVIGAEFRSKLRNSLAESTIPVTDIDACIMCAKPVNLQDHGSYVYDFDKEVICSGCTTVELKGELLAEDGGRNG